MELAHLRGVLARRVERAAGSTGTSTGGAGTSTGSGTSTGAHHRTRPTYRRMTFFARTLPSSWAAWTMRMITSVVTSVTFQSNAR